MDEKWVYCPRCGGKSRIKATPETVVVKLPFFCPKCKLQMTVDIRNMKVTKST